MTASSPTTFKYVSCWPAKDAPPLSSSTADDRTATLGSLLPVCSPNSRYASPISACKGDACSAPTAASYAAVVTQNPGGTQCQAASRLRFATFPPTSATSNARGSPNHKMCIRILNFESEIEN